MQTNKPSMSSRKRLVTRFGQFLAPNQSKVWISVFGSAVVVDFINDILSFLFNLLQIHKNSGFANPIGKVFFLKH